MVRDTSNPSRDALARGRTNFIILNLRRRQSLRGRPLTKLVAAERRIASPGTYIERLRRHDPVAAAVLAPVIDALFPRIAA